MMFDDYGECAYCGLFKGTTKEVRKHIEDTHHDDEQLDIEEM